MNSIWSRTNWDTSAGKLQESEYSSSVLLTVSSSTRLKFLTLVFLNSKGMPDLELGVNDINRQGKEVVGRHDIIPVKTEEWIRLEGLEFHSCVLNSDYEGDKVIK
jgi:hypothetical protein